MNKAISIITILVNFVFSFILCEAETLTTGIYSGRYKTLKTGVKDDFMSLPVIRLGSADRIFISFDEIGEDNSYLSARLIHCNSDWKQSGLVESEYIEGFNTIDIEDYGYSTNTFIHFVNYRLEIPSEGFAPMVSGNYVVQIYDRDEPDKTILEARFRVVEPIVGVKGIVSSRTDRGLNDKYQQVAVSVDTDGIEKCNPYQDLKVEVIQNIDETTSRFLTSPLRVDGKVVVYDHSAGLIFPASNEYRRFESTSNRFPGMRVDSVKYIGSNYHVWLYPDMPRAERNYEYDRTQHGRFIVREYNSTDSDLGADYITVHYFLDTPEIPGKNVYVDGEMTYGKYSEANRMRYNYHSGGYELETPLKQGAYNYRYVTRNVGENGVADPEIIEGNKYETDNEYNIFVYLRCPGDRYDRLVGYQRLGMN